MPESALYRKHHEGLERIVGEIDAALLNGSPTAIHNALSRLTNLLQTHLVMEGEVLGVQRQVARRTGDCVEACRIHRRNEGHSRCTDGTHSPRE